MNNFYLLKKYLILLISLCLVLLMSITINGCKTATADRTSKISDENTGISDTNREETKIIIEDNDLPDTIPVHPECEIKESKKEIEGNKESIFIKLEYTGKIKELSDWYKNKLPDNWQVDSESYGEFEDWTEYYVDAQDSYYFMSVYLYQDQDSKTVLIDINLDKKTGVAKQETPEEVQQTEQSTAEDEVSGQSVPFPGRLNDANIAFVCASVGSAWNINEHFPELNINVYDEYQFDKGYRISDILENDKPDIMIIKECAAYFPPESQGNSMAAYQDLIRDWVNLCRGQGVIPVLTTVVPIDPGNPSNWDGQLESLLEFNDWIIDYCSNENISVLDLEKALRASDTDRTLNPRYDSGDGLHPNDIAYSEKLDNILVPALERALQIGYR